MKKLIVISASVKQTQSLAKKMAPFLSLGDVLLLTAEIGSGKTTFIQGLAQALGYRLAAMSPTFVVAHTYQARIPLHHLDFYRLNKKEILDMGLHDYFGRGGEIEKGLLVIEWAERCRELWPPDYLEMTIQIKPKGTDRVITIKAHGPRYEKILDQLARIGNAGESKLKRKK